MIYLKNITRTFQNKLVLDNISFSIDDNSITALVGPNGIGKTTILNILCGVLTPDSGEIKATPPQYLKDTFTVQTGNRHLYVKNTVKENIIFFSVLRGLSTSQILDNIIKYTPYFPLYDSIQDTLFEKLSFGQKQLTTIFTALVSNSKYLLLDEPTEGLDLAHKKQLISVLSTIKKFKTILVTSHDSDFISSISDKLVFIKNAKIERITQGFETEQFLEIYNEIYEEEYHYANSIL